MAMSTMLSTEEPERPVYAESLAQYAEVRETAVAVRDAALSVIAHKLGGDLLIVNPTSFDRNDLAFWPGQLAAGQWVQRADGTPVPYLERRFPPQPGRLETIGTYIAAAPDRRDLAAAVALGRAELWWQVADAAGASDPDLVVDQPGTPVRLAMDPEGTT